MKLENRETFVTEPLNPFSRSRTQYGQVTNAEWCNLEVARINQNPLRKVEVVRTEDGLIAVREVEA